MNEREIAVSVLSETLEKGFGNIVLRSSLKRKKELSRVQKAFITECVNGTLRNLIKIDYVISRFSTVKVNRLKPYILNVLRISVYQLMFMDKVPPSACCNEAVKLVKKKGLGSLGGFVNGVLRNIARNIDKISYPDRVKEPVRYLSVMYSYPEELVGYFLENYGFSETEDMFRENNKVPLLSVAVNTMRTTDEGLIRALTEDNIAAAKANVGKGMLKISKTSDITECRAFGSGLFHVMDQSSFMCVKILDPKEGERILDICAAPGGKSFLAAYFMKNKGEIVSRDIYPHKIRLIESGAKRLGADIIKAELWDASKLKSEDIGKFDRVLADVPCSGLGLLRKKPDIKYNKTKGDIEALVKLQREILKTAAEYVKDGGVLVYSTCTISPLENEENVKWFLNEFDFEAEDIRKYVPENIKEESLEKGYINIKPKMWGSDGFFVAKFRKKVK